MRSLRLLAIFLFIAQCGFAQQSAEAAIQAAREQSNVAIERHDIQQFEQTLSPDFVMVRGSGVFVPSKEAYVKLFRDDFADPNAIRYRRIADKIEVSSAAPLAAEHGHWVGTNPDGSTAYRGTYLAMWRQTNGKWRVRSELYVVLACETGDACRNYVRNTEK